MGVRAQDTVSFYKPKLVKIGILHSLLLSTEPSLGIKYAGIAYEKYRNKKTSFNLFVDYFHVKENKFTTTGFYEPSLSDPLIPKHILSLRFLYKRYLFQKIKIFGISWKG